jgi:glycosyltransferase involved in cell wall biosynthesis
VPYKSPANGHLNKLKFFGKVAEVCRLSRHVTVGNEYLADYARRHNRNVSVIPTTIDTRIYLPQSPRNAAVPTIGWTGSYSTVQHLDILRPTLAQLVRTNAFKLEVIGTPAYSVEGVETTARAWSASTEVQDLSRMDIGIMPLPDDQWSRGKCGLKLLQYMALGIPVIGSDVGVNGTIIQDGVNGFLARTPAEWLEKLRRLLHEPELRHSLGQAGIQTVRENYSATVWAPRVGELFRNEVNAGKEQRAQRVVNA